jgi:hypothetical protein
VLGLIVLLSPFKFLFQSWFIFLCFHLSCFHMEQLITAPYTFRMSFSSF